MEPHTFTDLEATLAPFAAALGLRHGAGDAVALYGLAFARWLPVVTLAPFLGSRGVPTPVKVALSATLAAVLLPFLSATLPAPLAFSAFEWLRLVAREALVGCLLGLVAGLVFQAAEMAGQVLDLNRGVGMGNLFVPQTSQMSTVMGDFFVQLFIVLFVAVGGHRLFLAAVFDSYASWPLLQPGVEVSGLAAFFLAATADLFVLALRLIAPAVVLILLIDLVLGVANRMAPQLNVFFVGLSLKAALAVLAVALSFHVMVGLAHESFETQTGWTYELVGLLTPRGADDVG
ncbi:MAG: flagellar biosynthetic protein FliR [Acidobacteriota bacterium]